MSSHTGVSIPAITLVRGDADVLVAREVERLRKDVLRAVPDAEAETVSAATYEKGDLATLTSGSLFSPQKVLTITDLSAMSEAFSEDFREYLKNPAEDVWVVAIHEGGQKGQAVLRELTKAAFPTIKLDAPKSVADKAALVTSEVKAAGSHIEQQAAFNLVSALGDDLAELLAAAAQLASDSDGHVTEADVHQFYRGRVETKPWDVAQAAGERDFVRAILLVRQAFAVKVHPVVLVSALATEFRLLAKLKVPGIPTSDLGMPWLVNKARTRSNRWSEVSLGRALRYVADADAAVKGESRAPESAVELCIMKIARLD